MAKQNTLGEMETKVTEGLDKARVDCQGNDDLLKIIDNLAYTFCRLSGQLLIMSVGLSAMRYRTPEQNREQIQKYFDELSGARKRRDAKQAQPTVANWHNWPTLDS